MGWDYQDEDEEDEPDTWNSVPWYAVQESTEDEGNTSEGSSETSLNDGTSAEAGIEDQESLFVPDEDLPNEDSPPPPTITPGNAGPHTASIPAMLPPIFDAIPVRRPETSKKLYYATETSEYHTEVGRSRCKTSSSISQSEWLAPELISLGHCNVLFPFAHLANIGTELSIPSPPPHHH